MGSPTSGSPITDGLSLSRLETGDSGNENCCRASSEDPQSGQEVVSQSSRQHRRLKVSSSQMIFLPYSDGRGQKLRLNSPLSPQGTHQAQGLLILLVLYVKSSQHLDVSSSSPITRVASCGQHVKDVRNKDLLFRTLRPASGRFASKVLLFCLSFAAYQSLYSRLLSVCLLC